MELQRYEFFFNRPKHGIFAVFAKFYPSPAAKLGIFAVFAKFYPSPAAKLGIFAVFARFGGGVSHGRGA